MYWFVIHASGAIGLATGNLSPGIPRMGKCWGRYATLDATQQAVWNAPNTYLYQNGAFVAQSFWTLSSTASSDTYTVTATLNNPPTTPPSTATLTIAGSTLTANIASNQAVFTAALHPTVAMLAISATVSATSTVSRSMTLGGTQTTPRLGCNCCPPRRVRLP